MPFSGQIPNLSTPKKCKQTDKVKFDYFIRKVLFTQKNEHKVKEMLHTWYLLFTSEYCILEQKRVTRVERNFVGNLKHYTSCIIDVTIQGVSI